MTDRMLFRVVDSETTGIPSETDPHALVEIGWTDVVVMPGGVPLVLDPQAFLTNPGRAIPPEASAVHGLRDEHVRFQPPPDRVLPKLLETRPDYFVAHKAEFDRHFFGGSDVPWICSHKSALRVWQDAPLHSVQGLRYWLNVDDDPLFARELAQIHHRAGPDSYAAAWVFARMLAIAKVEDMARWSSGPALLITCYLNKHRGKRWADVGRDDPSYLSWIVDKSDISDRDIRATARYYLKNPPSKLNPQPQKESDHGDRQRIDQDLPEAPNRSDAGPYAGR